MFITLFLQILFKEKKQARKKKKKVGDPEVNSCFS